MVLPLRLLKKHLIGDVIISIGDLCARVEWLKQSGISADGGNGMT
jgi:hypothetical protein